MAFLERKAYRVWSSQRERCSSDKHPSYKYYGGKGVRVKYGSRDFISWFVNEIKNKNPISPSVGRIDHSKDYEFGNIEMVERGDNTREMLARTGGNKCGTVTVFVFEDRVEAYRSLSHAARSIGASPASVMERIKTNAGPKYEGHRKYNCEMMSLEEFMEL